MDHDMAYIALRDANPDWVAALMRPDAMTIPERLDDDGVARCGESGPVFSVDAPVARCTCATPPAPAAWSGKTTHHPGGGGIFGTVGSATTPTVFRLRCSPAWAWCATTCCMTARVLRTTCCTQAAVPGHVTWTEWPPNLSRLMATEIC
jgi:hypothetical protein